VTNGSRLSQTSGILVIRLREIGDVVFTTPAIRALRRQFPDAHLTYLVEPLAAEVVSGNPAIDEVLVAPRTGFVADLALGRRLAARGADLAIDFHGGPRASLLTWLSRARVRVGYDVPGRGWMYTLKVKRPREWRPRHAVQNQWDLLTALGIPLPDPAEFPVEMALSSPAAATVSDRLARAGVKSTDCLVVVHVSAGNPFRRWPQQSFAALVAGLASRDVNARVIVTAGPSEANAASAILEDARQRLTSPVRDRVMILGHFSLAELRALLAHAALFIGGDSGPLHIAATSGVPIVGLYGPTLPVRSQPWRHPNLISEAVEIQGLECRPCDQRVCTPGDFRCLTRMSPDMVMQAAERALARSAAAARAIRLGS